MVNNEGQEQQNFEVSLFQQETETINVKAEQIGRVSVNRDNLAVDQGFKVRPEPLGQSAQGTSA